MPTTTTTTTTTTTPSPFGPGDPVWTCSVGPGNTLYTVGYKAGQDDVRFNFENDNSYLDLPGFVLWNAANQSIDQAKRDILGYPLVVASAVNKFYVSRVTPMTALPFLQLTNARPYLFAVQLSGTGWGVPINNGPVKDPATCFPLYYWAKVNVHMETLTYDVYTDAEMVQFGLVDSNGNPDEATLARYVTKEVMPGMEYLTLPQGAFQFVATPIVGTTRPTVPGTAGKLTPNYDLSLVWEMVPQSCIGTLLYNPGLTSPPIDTCLGCCNNAAFPPLPTVTQQKLSAATVSAGGNGYEVGDVLFLLGGLPGVSARCVVATIGAFGAVATVFVSTPGNYIVNGGIPSPPANPVSTDTTGTGFGCKLTCTFVSLSFQQLMTSFPAAAGTGYTLGDVLVLSGGTGTSATVRVVAISTATATGPVLAVDILTRGLYQVVGGSPPANPVTTTGGTGTGCTLTCEFGNGIPPGQLLMTAAAITPIRSSAGDRLYRLGYRFKYLPQGVQRLYYQGTPGSNFRDANYFEVTTNGLTNIGSGKYNNDPTNPPVNIYPWADMATLFRVPS